MAPPRNEWAYELANQHDLKSGQRNVLMALAHHRNKKTEACFPSVKRLAKLTGLDRRTVQRHLKALQSKGVITMTAQYKHGVQQTNLYGFPQISGLGGGKKTAPRAT